MNPRSFDRFPPARKNPGIRANGHRGKASQADSRRSRLETQEQDLHTGLHPPSECQLKQPSNTQYSYVETRNAGIHCPFLTSRNGFPGRCAINTETSAVKYLRVRRQRWSDQHSIPCVAAVFVLYMADHLTTRLICHSRARSTATSDVTLGECVQWQGCLRVLEWQNGKDFPIRRWQTSNARASKTRRCGGSIALRAMPIGFAWRQPLTRHGIHPPCHFISNQERGGRSLKRRLGL